LHVIFHKLSSRFLKCIADVAKLSLHFSLQSLF